MVWKNLEFCKSVLSLEQVNALMMSWGALIHPMRKSGANVLEKVPSAMVKLGSSCAKELWALPSYR